MFFFFQAEDGIRDLVRSRGLGDVYKRQLKYIIKSGGSPKGVNKPPQFATIPMKKSMVCTLCCLLYTSDAADERSSVDLGGRRIIKKKKKDTKKRQEKMIIKIYEESRHNQ